MWATIAFLVGVAVAGVVLAVFRKREPRPAGALAGPTPLGWVTLASGIAAVAAFAVGVFTDVEMGGFLASIACATAAVIFGIGAILRHDRFWPTWAGLAIGVIPGVFWIAFAVGNILGLGSR